MINKIFTFLIFISLFLYAPEFQFCQLSQQDFLSSKLEFIKELTSRWIDVKNFELKERLALEIKRLEVELKENENNRKYYQSDFCRANYSNCMMLIEFELNFLKQLFKNSNEDGFVLNQESIDLAVKESFDLSRKYLECKRITTTTA